MTPWTLTVIVTNRRMWTERQRSHKAPTLALDVCYPATVAKSIWLVFAFINCGI